MIIVDTALAKRKAENNPVRVGMVGAGFMGKAIALQICTAVPGMELVAISNRTLENAKQAYKQAGVSKVAEVNSVSELNANIKKGRYSITNNVTLLCEAEGIDAIIEVTGAVEFGAYVSLNAIKGGKHIIFRSRWNCWSNS
jgi:predicted homoserine dehydrogenase-like protein